MSIATAIDNAQQKVANCYTSVDNMGGILPATQNLSNLPAAIESIPGGDEVTISGSNIPANQRVIIGFTPSGVPYLTSYFTEFAYTGISNGDTTFRTALPNPLPHQISYNTVGSPVIDDYYKTSNWSTSDYIDTGITLDYYSGNWEWICKAYYVPNSTNQVLLGAVALYYGFSYYEGNDWRRTGNTTKHISATNTYWFRVRCVDGVLMGYFLTDNNYTVETLPSLSSWSGCTVKSYQSSYTGNVTIGKYASASYRNQDYIYLDSIRIYSINTTNNTKTLIWQMFEPFDTTPIPDDTTGVQPSGDWTVQGNVPLDYRWGYLNSFGSSNYIKAKTFRWNLANAKSIYAKGHFKTPSSLSTSYHQPLLAYTTNGYSSPVLIYYHSTNKYLSGTFGVIIPANVTTNTEYWFEATLDNQGNRTVKYSTDGETWTTTSDTVTAPSWEDYTDVPSVGYWGNGNFYWGGTIYDLETGYVDANDETHTFKLWK